MRLLLDTHIAIWALTDPDRLGQVGQALIGNEANDVFVSAASVWEISIKFALKRPGGAPPFSGADALRYFREAGYRFLDITPEHAAGVEDLPAIHSDPFDRIQVAQALLEPMRLITADPLVARYSDTIILIS